MNVAIITARAGCDNNGLLTAIILGAAFALSSTAIVMQLLTENRRLGTAVGQTSFAVLLFQDLAVLPILFLVGIFAAGTEGSIALSFAVALGQVEATGELGRRQRQDRRVVVELAVDVLLGTRACDLPEACVGLLSWPCPAGTLPAGEDGWKEKDE